MLKLGHKYNNGYFIDNGSIYVVELKKLSKNDSCPFNPEKPDLNMACGVITIDINGFNAPNTNITRDTINDRFRFLIYPKKVLLYPSDEYDFYVNSTNNRFLAEGLNTEIFNEYWDYNKKLHVEDTFPRLKVIVENNNDKTTIEKQLEIRFYDANNKQIDSWVWNIPSVPSIRYIFEKELDFSKLNKNIKTYDVTLLTEQKETNFNNNADYIYMEY